MSASKKTEMLDLKYTLLRHKLTTRGGINAQPITLQALPAHEPDFRLIHWLICHSLSHGNSKFNPVEGLLKNRKIFF
jgi:hypothetical protein